MSCYQLESSLGYSVAKQNNIDLIDDGKLLFIVGNTIQILDINTKENNYGKFNDNHIIINGHSNGIGAFAIHPNKKSFAFGEIGHNPHIYIYSYPQLKKQTILKNGTQRRYSDMKFNKNGNYLASIGGSPDHMLTIWDWKLGTVILRAKAFSQDVFSVRFSPYNQNRLITAGTGHIRFWEMAKTFTGLKLQGKIGKFGEVDLSDIWSYVEFPSGKVLSGSESGDILMWQTDLIQFVVKPQINNDTDDIDDIEDNINTDTLKCHNGNIIYIDIYKENEENILISAGVDGYIKFWDCSNIEFFEPSDDLSYYPLKLKHEIKVNSKYKSALVSMIKYKNLYWIIQDAAGSLWKLTCNNYKLTSVIQFHGLYVTSIKCLNQSHNMITSGKDGTIRYWDLQTQTCEIIKRIQSSINLLLTLKTNQNNYFIIFCDDGVVRIIEKRINLFVIIYSLRIHDQPIIHAAISSNSKYLATITEKQLFFSEIIVKNDEISIEPIGFVLLSHKLTKIYWSMDNETLYSYYKHDIITYKRPIADQFDTTSTFQINLTPTNTTFIPFLTEQDTKEDEPKKANKEETENENKENKNNEDNKQKEEKKEKENIFDTIKWKISCILPSFENNTNLLITIKAIDNESFIIPNFYEYNIKSNEIIKFYPTFFKDDKAHNIINNLSYSNSSQFILISTENSIIQVRDFNDPFKNYINIRIHNSWAKITNNLISMSFDDRLLISSSNDGSLFCHLFDPNKLKHPKFDENFDFDYISSINDNDNSIKQKQDVHDMSINDYSVEGEKRQKELDNAQSAAEKYKSELRKELNNIRTQKKIILNQTKDIIKNDLGLNITDLDIDIDLRSKMKDKLEKDKQQIRREMAWNSEKVSIGLQKLENAFLKSVTTENISVSSFYSNHTVSTFRTPILPSWLTNDINKVHEIINAEQIKIDKEKQQIIERNQKLKSLSPSKIDNINNNNDKENQEINGKKSSLNSKQQINNKRSASEQKKYIREKLKNALEEARKEKPDENADDPKDIETINNAKKNIGDYKLKSSPNYIVPENEHINASQKRKQIILLLESINYIKIGLNERVLALRDLKKRIVENITNDTERLNKINEILSKNKHKTIIKAPVIDLYAEFPNEQRYNYTKNDLIEFEKLLKQEMDEKSGNNNAFGGGGGVPTSRPDSAIKSPKKSSSSLLNRRATNSGLSSTYSDRLKSISLSSLQENQLICYFSALKYEREILLNKISSTILTFDSAVSELRCEKSKLMSDLKSTDLKFLRLLRELVILSSFEEKEIFLNGKLLKCRTEKAQIVVDLTECQERLSKKLEEIYSWQEKDFKIMKEFDNIVGGERNQFYDSLKKIFIRKIKRNKRNLNNNNNDKNDDNDDSSSDDDDDSLYSSDSDDDDDDSNSDNDNSKEIFDDSCPKDCDNLIYEKVMELREKRLDQCEVLIEFEKSVSSLKTQNFQLISREKNIDKNLFNTEKEIELFQNEKQKYLNKIIINVPLLLSQIRTDSAAADCINNSLIFELCTLYKLENRIISLKNEKIQIKKDYFELKKLYKLLNKKINFKKNQINIEKKKCKQVQYLKYGRLISLNVLDSTTNINSEIEILQNKINKIKKESSEKLNLWNKKFKNIQNKLLKKLNENTINLKNLTDLNLKKNNLKNELNKISKIKYISDSAPSDQKRNNELQKLVTCAKKQAEEIDILKAEIHMLQRKGGILYQTGGK